MSDYQIFSIGDFVLQKGMTLKNCQIAYKTYGKLSEKKDNVIVYPTWYSGQHYDNEWLIGKGMGLDPEKYFIIVPNMIGNGLSTSPNNTIPAHSGSHFPNITVYDNVRAQHLLITQVFGISKIKLVTGWSMGAGQTYQWAVSYPDMVERIVPFCGSARTSTHNIVFLEGVKAALKSSEIHDQRMRACARVYAGWGFSQAFYREKVYEKMGFATLEDFLVGFWENLFLTRRDPNNLLTMLWTWQNGNIANTPGLDGDFEKALASIKAKAIVMPAQIDLYFPPEDNEYEVKHMPNAELRVIPGVWGHFAGAGINKVDTDFIDQAIKDILSK